MSIERISRGVFVTLVLGALLRVVVYLWLPTLAGALDGRIEISTPVSSYRRLHEGIFMYNNGIDPYAGNTVHSSPLILAFFTVLDRSTAGLNSLARVNQARLAPISVQVVYGIVDLTAAYYLSVIGSLMTETDKFQNCRYVIPNWVYSAVYLFNPFSLLTSLALSTTALANGLVVISVGLAVQQLAYTSVVLMVFAGSIAFYPLYWLIPLGAICLDYQPKLAVVKLITFTLLTITLMGFICQLVAPRSSWISQTFGVILTFGELTPNIGLWWYFFIEMFDYFRPFFLGVFQVHLFSYTIPTTIRLRRFPIFAFTVVLALTSLFKSYPEIGDFGLFYSLVPLFSFTFPHLKYRFVSSLTIFHAVALGPVFHHLWIYLGSGNANFFYAITLVHSLGFTILLIDLVWAILRIEYDGAQDNTVVQI
ncbi:PIG-U-domain-containing protein [Nadsonia fulvescens var. elongata DSM 6958]|uniref:PIG-U-domain-containing protein n=1 Tax=Nadsonia fulvescens var. elongata DSM 6958 TaxID=857566 RepID=A0A1E3PJA2_9ASCO|nr:PIG-U-domain-containing protein [Nadsonia fulvescens var. elongata DSM 6958]